MRPLFAILVGLLVFSMSMGSQIYALFGPCTTDREGFFENTIRCTTDGCAGHVRVESIQRTCKELDDSECDQNDNALYSTVYDFKVTTNFTFEMLVNFGAGVACASCALSLLALIGSGGGTVASLLMGGVCSATCGVLFNDLDRCLYTTCEQDLDSREATKGGHFCD